MVLSVSSLSAFMNNTTVAAILLAPVAGIARRRKWSPSKLLMPMAFAAILGGTCTLIGTSPNVAVSGYMARAGLGPLGFFELTPVGVLIVTIGTAYLALLGRHLLPDNPTVDLAEDYGLREYLSEILIKEDSPLSGQQIQHSDLGQLGFRILKVLREGKPRAPRPDLVLTAGDVLIVNGPVESLMKVRETEGIEIRPDVAFGEKELKADELEILEVLVTPESFLRGRRLQSLDLPRRLGIVVLAVNRHGPAVAGKLKTVRLETGDLLLVQGARASMKRCARVRISLFSVSRIPAAHRGKKGLL